MKRVGLITYYGENYGGMLQAYALQRQICELGMECELISDDFLHVPKRRRRIAQKVKNLCALLKNPRQYLVRRKAVRSGQGGNALRSAKFRDFLEKHLNIYQTGYVIYQQYVDNPPLYDTYICGSDQIWNPNLYCDNGFYFGNFAPEDKEVVSYASSIGTTQVTAKQADFMRPNLERLSSISVREKEGAGVVEGIVGKRPRVVLDPTLLLNAEQWNDVAVKPLYDKPYIFCYLFGDRDYIGQIKEKVKQITGLKVICLPYAAREFGGNDIKVFDAGPAEFVGLIQNAALVLTDSFHATAFSINLKVPFFSLLRFSDGDKKSMNSRLYTLLDELELRDRLIDEGMTITTEMLTMDFTRAHELLEKRREEDRSFLKKILKG